MNGLLYDGSRAWALMRQPDVDLAAWRRRVRMWAIGFNAVIPKRHPKERVIEIARVVADDTWHAKDEGEARRRGLEITRDYLNGQSIDSLASRHDISPRRVEERIRSHGGKIVYSGHWPEDPIEEE